MGLGQIIHSLLVALFGVSYQFKQLSLFIIQFLAVSFELQLLVVVVSVIPMEISLVHLGPFQSLISGSNNLVILLLPNRRYLLSHLQVV